MKETLEIKVCERCGKKTAEEVIDYIDKVRRGWYCRLCFHWDKASLRERKI